MKSLVTKKEEKILKQFLALSPMPEITLSYFELRGFIYGIAITPDAIPPSEWVPIIFGDDMPDHDSEELAKEMTGTLYTVLNKHIAAFQNDALYMPFEVDILKDEEFTDVIEWTSGFEEALSLRPEFWEESEDLSDEEREHLTNSLIVLEGIVYPEDAIDMFDHIPKGDLLEIGIQPAKNDNERAMQVQYLMLQALELSIETIQQHGVRLEKIRKERIRNTGTRIKSLSSRIDKETMCPCGSGKKFRNCCSLPPDNNKKKEGKLIKVEFPQHGSKKKKKTAVLKVPKGPWKNYQLEITLAYTEPEIWRRVQIPGSMTLYDLHMVIQLCMGWQDQHMHQFEIGGRFYGPQLADGYTDEAMLDDSRFTLADFESSLLQGIVYTYDFGDDWQHVIMLEKIIPESEGISYPVLLEGGRACPPEDIGGIPMYQEFLKYLADPDEDKELKEMFDQPGLKGYDPDSFSLKDINKLLRKLYDKK